MKKMALAMLLVLVWTAGLLAEAAGPSYTVKDSPELRFEGNMAICKALVRANNSTSYITATMKLWSKGVPIRTWKQSGKVSLSFSQKAGVVPGGTYTLTIDAVVGGVKQPQRSTTRICPR